MQIPITDRGSRVFKPGINDVVTLYRNDGNDKISDSSDHYDLNMRGNITLIGSGVPEGGAIIGNDPRTAMN